MTNLMCIVKGLPLVALTAARDRGLPAEILREHPRFAETQLLVPDEYRAEVVRWFCETAEAPFPVGTLLFYTEAQ